MPDNPLLQALFLGSGIGQYLTTLEGLILEVNPAFASLLQCPRDHLRNRPIQDFLLPEGSDYLLREESQVELQYQSGELVDPIWALATKTPVLNKHDQPVLWLTQVQDLTAKKKLETDLRRNAKDLEQFAYIASHDLREPLITTAGYATIMQRRCKDSLTDEGRHFLEQILTSTKRLELKVDALLAFSRAGRDEPKGTVDLEAAFAEAVLALDRVIQRTQAEVTYTGPRPLILKGNHELIAQVLQNLLSNALKYKREAPKIKVGAKPAGPCCWIIQVEDNGLGFPMEHHDRIFGVFTRLYTPEEYPGTGIGLAIAKKVVNRHGGRIWAESVPGLGSTFFFTMQAANG